MTQFSNAISASGEMADRVRQHDWANTHLNAIDDWPTSVRIATNNLLSSPFPACGCFGAELVMIYNDAFIPILGDKHPALGQSFRTVWSEAWDVIGPIAQKALAGKSTFIQDFPLSVSRHACQHELAYFTFSYSPLHGEDGSVIGMLDTVFESTMAVEARMAESLRSARLEHDAKEHAGERDRMWRLSVDAMVVLDADLRLQAVNPAFLALLGWTKDEVVGRPFIELVDPAERSRVVRTLQRDAKRPFIELEAQLRRKDGKLISIQWSGAGHEHVMLLFGRDLTATEEASALLEQTESALRQSQKLESIGRLTGGVAHDFNNLLQVISGNLQLLSLELPDNPAAHQRLEGALAGVTRGAKLTSHLLAFSRRQALDPAVLQVGHVITAMEDMLKSTLGEACEVNIRVARNAWNSLVDRTQLESAVLNLCINARDAMEGAGRLSIDVFNAELDETYAARHSEVSAGDYVLIAVSDTGSGMSSEVLQNAFEPFFTTKAEGKGSGLGLSMVFGFIKQSGGHIKIYSEPGHGTTMKLYLPRSLESPIGPVDMPPLAPLAGGTETILVVEDDADVQGTAVALLRQLGYNVLKASEASGALAIVESGAPIDLLFTDVVMPGPIRSPVLATKAREVQPNMAVLFTSGFTENAIVHGGRLDPGVQLLTKPYPREALARKVRQLLDGSKQQQEKASLAYEAVHETTRRQSPAGQHILFVDDDLAIQDVSRELLKSLGHRVSVAGSADEALERLTPDVTVLITDVNLPGVSGDELARMVRMRLPHVGVIFASGDDHESSLPTAVDLRKPYRPSQLEDAVVRALGLDLANG